MKLKKIFSSVIICSLIAVSSVGCGNSGTGTANSDTPNGGTTANSGGTSDNNTLANDINGLFGGSGLDGQDVYDRASGFSGTNGSGIGYYDEYGNSLNSGGLTGQNNGRFGFGMNGAENIIGNDYGATGNSTTGVGN